MTLSFFRRHRKMFMVLMFLGLISMVGFGLWPTMWPVVSRWLGLEGHYYRTIGTIAGHSVGDTEVRDFQQSVGIAGQASQWMAMALEPQATTSEAKQRLYGLTVGMTAWPILESMARSDKPGPLILLTWLALYEEARQYGFDTSASEVESRLKELQAMGLAPEVLGQMVDRLAGGQRARLLDAFRKDMTLRAYINWLDETLSGAVEPEMRQDFVRMDERMKVRLAALKAEDAVAEVKDVPQDALQSQFDKYKAVPAGQGPEGYGYRIADRVAVEYLAADLAAFEAAVQAKVTDADVREYYDARKDPEFVVKEEPAVKKDAPKDEDKKDAASEEKDEAKPAEKKFRPFEDVRDEIRKTLLGRAAAGQARERLNADVAEIRSMKKTPDLGIWADGKQVRYVVVPGFHTAQQLGELKGIGRAVRGKDPMPTFALAVAELVGAAKARLAVNEISEVFVGPDGEAYAFRVTGVERSHEPANLAEVRDKVLADVRLAKAFEIVRERGKKLLEAAAAKGLEAAAKDAAVKTVESDLFPRERMMPVPYAGQWLTIPPTLPEVGSNRVVVAECFRTAAEGRQRTLVTLAEERMVVVAEVVERKAARQVAYNLMRPLLAARAGQQVREGALRKALDLAAIRRRMEVVLKVPEGSRMPDGEPPADDGGDL